MVLIQCERPQLRTTSAIYTTQLQWGILQGNPRQVPGMSGMPRPAIMTTSTRAKALTQLCEMTPACADDASTRGALTPVCEPRQLMR